MRLGFENRTLNGEVLLLNPDKILILKRLLIVH